MNVEDIVSVVVGAGSGWVLNGDQNVPDAPGNADYQVIQEWIALGNTPDPYVPPPEPTVDELYDALLEQQKITKALISALNDGSFVPGSNYTNTQIKNGLKNRL